MHFSSTSAILIAGICGTALFAAATASAQWTDDFADGDFSQAPAWTGESESWRVVPWNGGFALQSDGPAARDTLSLATLSAIATGSWTFTVAYDSVNLSNFNGIRVFLMADTDALEGPVRGYYLQLGANNSDQVRLYRMDGNPSTGRVLLGASEEQLLSAFSDTLAVTVTRSVYSTWQVLVDGTAVIEAADATYSAGAYFGFWVKQTADTRQSYTIDDIHAAPAAPSEYPAPEPRDIVVNEIMYDPPTGESEYIELYNRSGETFDLGRLLMSDDTEDPRRIVREPLAFPPNGYVVLVENLEQYSDAFPGVSSGAFRDVTSGAFAGVSSGARADDPSDVIVLEPTSWPALNNGEDAVLLLHESNLVDGVPYEAALPRDVWSGAALERIDPAGPSWHKSNFGPSTAPKGGTPGRRNSIYAPDRIPPAITFVEAVEADILHVYLDEPVATASLRPSQFEVGGIDGREIHVMSDTALAVRFDGPIASGDMQTAGVVRVSGLEDLSGNVSNEQSHPIAWPIEKGELVINEFLHDPRADAYDGEPDQSEYIEFYNRSGRLLSLHKAFVAGPADENGHADTTYVSSHPAAIAPDSFAVLLASSNGSLGLSNSGDIIRLHAADGLVVDSVRYSAAWEAPFASGPGISLERIDPNGRGSDPLNWSSSRDASGGTPGRRNSISPHPEARPPAPGDLVINEIMYEPDEAAVQSEYIELHNISSKTLELNGLSLVPPSGADTIRLAYTPAALAPGGFAVALAAAIAADIDTFLHAFPDAGEAVAGLFPTGTSSLRLRAKGGIIRVLGADSTILASVRYAADFHHPHLEITKGTSLERIDPLSDGSRADNWSSSAAPEGGTPGRENSLFISTRGPPNKPGVTVAPVAFSPDGDGFDDVTFISYELESAAPRIRLRIFDDAGYLVRTLEESRLSARTGRLPWDGHGREGRILKMGIYIVLIEAVDPDRGVVEAHKAPVVLAQRLE